MAVAASGAGIDIVPRTVATRAAAAGAEAAATESADNEQPGIKMSKMYVHTTYHLERCIDNYSQKQGQAACMHAGMSMYVCAHPCMLVYPL